VALTRDVGQVSQETDSTILCFVCNNLLGSALGNSTRV
jgi:hypothetical protein